MAEMTVKLTARVRWWTIPMFRVASYPCVVIEAIHKPFGEYLSGKLTSFIAKHGVKVIAE